MDSSQVLESLGFVLGGVLAALGGQHGLKKIKSGSSPTENHPDEQLRELRDALRELATSLRATQAEQTTALRYLGDTLSAVQAATSRDSRDVAQLLGTVAERLDGLDQTQQRHDAHLVQLLQHSARSNGASY